MPEIAPHLDVPGSGDMDDLVRLWEASVRATHRFLAEADIDFLRQLVREQYLPSAQLVGVRDTAGAWLAFMGVRHDEIEALFVHPRAHRRGIGRLLARHAIDTLGAARVEVNEQNRGAIAFYERLGFIVTGRSELDGQGRPFPLLHMALRGRE